jgi:hypothetical protein
LGFRISDHGVRRALRVLFHPTEEKNPNERVPGGAKVKTQMEFTDDLNESEGTGLGTWENERGGV